MKRKPKPSKQRANYYQTELKLETEHINNLTSVHRPFYRRLRVFAYDPSLGISLETASLNEVTLKVIWEVDRLTGKSVLAPGPIGEYIEVVDYDPASRSFYAPVNLNDPHLLAQDGLKPSEENPQFHQQMVYAVSMTTIDFFEQALGRVILWAPRIVRDKDGKFVRSEYVQRLRIYPHALREANAYYNPQKKALLFGYFQAAQASNTNSPNIVFTCLSQDIIVHEITHALLDGIHPRFIEATNPDVHAFHEAFSDIVALFQHFSNSDVLEDTIKKTKGDLAKQNLLGELAQEFGQAISHRQALRDAIGHINPETGEWQMTSPNPQRLVEAIEPHDRGAILVAAIFRTFLLIYKSRIQDLLRIATQGSGQLPPGELHPDLVKRLAHEAAKVARHMLNMCIRGLDYCTPVDITFGDFLRAIITGDFDMENEDPKSYRVALVQTFKEWGISAEGIRNFSIESLRYRSHLEDNIKVPADILGKDWDLYVDRKKAFNQIPANGGKLHYWLTKSGGKKYLKVFGLTLSKNAAPTVNRIHGLPAIEVHSIRPALRRGPRNNLVTDLVAEITQKRKGFFDPEQQMEVDKGTWEEAKAIEGDFIFRRGCTLIIDMITLKVRYIIKTQGDVTDNTQLDRVRQYLLKGDIGGPNAFLGLHQLKEDAHEHGFAAIHRR